MLLQLLRKHTFLQVTLSNYKFNNYFFILAPVSYAAPSISYHGASTGYSHASGYAAAAGYVAPAITKVSNVIAPAVAPIAKVAYAAPAVSTYVAPAIQKVAYTAPAAPSISYHGLGLSHSAG